MSTLNDNKRLQELSPSNPNNLKEKLDRINWIIFTLLGSIILSFGYNINWAIRHSFNKLGTRFLISIILITSVLVVANFFGTKKFSKSNASNDRLNYAQFFLSLSPIYFFTIVENKTLKLFLVAIHLICSFTFLYLLKTNFTHAPNPKLILKKICLDIFHFLFKANIYVAYEDIYEENDNTKLEALEVRIFCKSLKDASKRDLKEFLQDLWTSLPIPFLHTEENYKKIILNLSEAKGQTFESVNHIVSFIIHYKNLFNIKDFHVVSSDINFSQTLSFEDLKDTKSTNNVIYSYRENLNKNNFSELKN